MTSLDIYSSKATGNNKAIKKIKENSFFTLSFKLDMYISLRLYTTNAYTQAINAAFLLLPKIKNKNKNKNKVAKTLFFIRKIKGSKPIKLYTALSITSSLPVLNFKTFVDSYNSNVIKGKIQTKKAIIFLLVKTFTFEK
ncbi:hypothetical protein LFREDSHE_33230 [Shewanella baltica]